ncbi:hypothetical protein QYE76_007745 [Lolium multiflorum]|jgi:hypothetical protein|uniref:Uncharacterized protein n=1 Tax=Lolium multiflorum TaxID=4521 RepID=A0AAD8QJ44_LOLMU|nr:hypothetical protein QYE76_007745 [Lolium multiflorum]
MKEIEGSKLRRLTNFELQARIDLLHQQIADEEKQSFGSRHHVKLLQDCEEAVNIKYIRNMETIERLEEKVNWYKAKWTEQVEANRMLLAALSNIRNATDEEIMRSIT